MTKEQAHLIRKMRATQIAHSMMAEIISIVVAKVCLFFCVVYIVFCVLLLFTEFSPRLDRLKHRSYTGFCHPSSPRRLPRQRWVLEQDGSGTRASHDDARRAGCRVLRRRYGLEQGDQQGLDPRARVSDLAYQGHRP